MTHEFDQIQLPDLSTSVTTTYDYDDYEPEPLSDEEIDRIIAEYEREQAEEEAEEAERLANAPTPEEFEAMANSREHYAEAVQFVTSTHTSKQDGKTHKREASSGTAGGARFATAFFTFDELVDQHEAGMTFRKLPEASIPNWDTRFLVMDFDNTAMEGHDPVNVTTDELDQMIDMCKLTARYTHSGDRLDYHHHLFILLDTPVHNADEYKAVRDKTEDQLRTALEFLRHTSALPRLTDPKLYSQTTVFAPKQASEHIIKVTAWEISPDGKWTYGQPTEHLERTNDFPMPRTTSTTDAAMRDYLVPISSPQFARWLVIHGINQKERITDLEYDFRIGGNLLKYMRPGATKATMPIREGTRHNTVNAFLLKLYAKARGYNVWLHDHGYDDFRFTDNDIIDSFKLYMTNAYEVGSGFELDTYVDDLKKLCTRHKNETDRDYCESIKRFITGRTKFKTRHYVRDTAQEIIDRFKDADGVVRFESVATRDALLHDEDVSLPTLRKVASLERIKVATGRKGGVRVGAGRKPSVTWESLNRKGSLVDGVFVYEGNLSPSEKKFLQRQDGVIKIKQRKRDKSM